MATQEAGSPLVGGEPYGCWWRGPPFLGKYQEKGPHEAWSGVQVESIFGAVGADPKGRYNPPGERRGAKVIGYSSVVEHTYAERAVSGSKPDTPNRMERPLAFTDR